jgi:hypothetical protein
VAPQEPGQGCNTGGQGPRGKQGPLGCVCEGKGEVRAMGGGGGKGHGRGGEGGTPSDSEEGGGSSLPPPLLTQRFGMQCT